MTDERTKERTEKHACDSISRQAAYDALLPAAQPTQDDEVTFWKERAREYENIVTGFVAEQTKGMKLDSIEITGESIVFKMSQPTDAEIQKMQDIEQAEIQKAYELGKLDAMEEMPHWIPCSEMMPVSDGIYIVDDYRHGKHWIHTVGYMKRSNSWCEQHGIYYDDKYGRYDKQEDIIAWMPLPEPYRER